jgi:RimJ/RimL family protein N-acetyltransferase
MLTFSEYKGLRQESSFSLSIDSSILGFRDGLKLECRVAGSWLLGRDIWLEQMRDARDESKEMYFARFPPSIESLSTYLLTGPIMNKSQILFLIIDKTDNLYGHVGLKVDESGNVEIDNILRTSRDLPGIMKIALDKIMCWGSQCLGISEYFLKVISTNRRAISFYNSVGFSLQDERHLRIERVTNEILQLIPVSVIESNTEEKMLIMKRLFKNNSSKGVNVN